LAQIDSSIGGKTAVDLPIAKNIIGVFHQPKVVIIDSVFLKTLPPRELRQGIAEAIKYAAISDRDLFTFLENNSKKILNFDCDAISHVTEKCASIKALLVAKDERETKGIRTILNFGHTLGHALESSLKYAGLNHGEAVAIGMVFASELSLGMGLCEKNIVTKINSLIKAFGLPTRAEHNPKTTIAALMHDKKFTSGKIRMVMLESIGKTLIIDGINTKIIESCLKKLSSK
jgi:3-dehydroquinate synthase